MPRGLTKINVDLKYTVPELDNLTRWKQITEILLRTEQRMLEKKPKHVQPL